MNEQFCLFTSRVQVTTGRGLPVTSQDKVTGSPFFTTASPVDGTGFTLGGTATLKQKRNEINSFYLFIFFIREGRKD